MQRRDFLHGLMAAPMVWPLSGLMAAGAAARRRVVVIGAGAFGGWAALNLARSGAEVTLIEAWAAGHPRSSSGGETRVIRHMYSNPLYARMAARSLALFEQAQREWNRPLLHRSGVLFLGQDSAADYFQAGTEALRQSGIEFEHLDRHEISARWPQIALHGIEQATFEPQSGYLLARRACHAVFQALQGSGGRVITGKAMPGPIRDGRLQSVRLTDGQEIVADDFLFACGPWLPGLFPELLGPLLSTSRQEVYYFGTPPGDRAHDEAALPVWADFGPRLWYGIPGSERRGFKIADDTHGPKIDPERAQRIPSLEGIEAARGYIEQRFPGLADAPLVDARVCQYTNTGNGDFIVDRHPEAANLWLAGGGSGHGFKHGPALGELLAESLLGERIVEPQFTLERHRGAAAA
ncbi:MAG: FAD-dependent oxidoreductase [Wenzhouxiangellaceae bacterium]